MVEAIGNRFLAARAGEAEASVAVAAMAEMAAAETAAVMAEADSAAKGAGWAAAGWAEVVFEAEMAAAGSEVATAATVVAAAADSRCPRTSWPRRKLRIRYPMQTGSPTERPIKCYHQPTRTCRETWMYERRCDLPSRPQR